MSDFVPQSGDEWCYVLPDVLQADPEYKTKLPDGTIGPRGAAPAPAPAPAVFILGEEGDNKNSHSVPLDRDAQFFIANIMSLSEFGRLFGDLTQTEREFVGSAFRGVLGDRKAFANGKGFQGDLPRRDYINRKDLHAAEIPWYDKIRTTATNSHKGEIVGTNLRVGTFDVDNLPDVSTLDIANDPRIFYASIQYAGGHVGPFPNLSKGVPLPLFSRRDVFYPLANLEQTVEKRELYL